MVLDPEKGGMPSPDGRVRLTGGLVQRPQCYAIGVPDRRGEEGAESKAKLSIYRSIYVPTLTMRWGEAQSLGRSRIEPLLPRIERSQLRWLGHYFGCPLDASLGRCSRRVPLGKGPWKTQDTLERLCLSAGLGMPWESPWKSWRKCWGEGSLGISAQTAASATRSRIKRMKMDGWMDGWTYIASLHDTAALYCTAKNEIGQGKSKSVQLNVLYAPEINVMSSCSSEAHMVKCVCIVDSKPPSMVHFVLPEHRVLHNATKTEKHGTITIANLLAELGSSEFVLCLASNTQGNANLTLYVSVDSKMHSLYIIITAGAGGILIILLISVGAVKK
ncbi:hypothetical protein L3Q82_013126 [Scortum barcoo]|uniref:Uncharacterized protein n=1 Tax=Scortum barcoo TaxID=214431 RepID=A0ACB8W0A9_9TELE|nr:hypothetical protein L3Q82_013126 [Scortum barcoo]